MNSSTVIAKIARFEWEIPRIEQETRAYQLLDGQGLAPRFLAHIHEDGRLIGFVLENVQGRPASLQDLGVCKAALKNVHALGLLHGDANKYNFIITDNGVKMIDFENSCEQASIESMATEMQNLHAELLDDSGRGGGFIFGEEPD